MLEQDKNDKRKERHHITQEDFTPEIIVELMLTKLPQDTFTNFDKKVIDNSCGIGNFLVAILDKRLSNCTTTNKAIKALSTIYGVELMVDNVAECRERLYNTITNKFPCIKEDEKLNHKVRAIIKHRIMWNNSLQFDYKDWGKLRTWGKRDRSVSFTEIQRTEDVKYPMWYKENVEVVEPTLFGDIDWE